MSYYWFEQNVTAILLTQRCQVEYNSQERHPAIRWNVVDCYFCRGEISRSFARHVSERFSNHSDIATPINYHTHFSHAMNVEEKFLESLLSKRLRITIKDGRIIDGNFMCTDDACNVVISNCEEFLTQSVVGTSVQQVLRFTVKRIHLL